MIESANTPAVSNKDRISKTGVVTFLDVLDWIGVHLTPSALYTVGDSLEHWTQYQPPLKDGKKHETHCVKWLDAWQDTVSGQDPKIQLQNVFRDMGPITPDFAMKFVNTMAYFDKLCKK